MKEEGLQLEEELVQELMQTVVKEPLVLQLKEIRLVWMVVEVLLVWS
jgi:hypothetical protein